MAHLCNLTKSWESNYVEETSCNARIAGSIIYIFFYLVTTAHKIAVFHNHHENFALGSLRISFTTLNSKVQTYDRERETIAPTGNHVSSRAAARTHLSRPFSSLRAYENETPAVYLYPYGYKQP